MSKVLCTFSGPRGDILWSLATVKAISQMVNEPVDMVIMGAYESLIPILQYQPYINKATAAKDWIAQHSNHGDQPWYPPKEVEEGYEQKFHLTYRSHPGLTAEYMALIDFIAHQQGIRLKDPVPFIECLDYDEKPRTIALGFNYQYKDLKDRFTSRLQELCPDYSFVDVTELPWLTAATFIKSALGFVGCRSSNNVIAHGVGQDNIFIYEPHPSRHQDGMLGGVFGCPYHAETTVAHSRTPQQAAEIAATVITNWKKSIKKEDVCA